MRRLLGSAQLAGAATLGASLAALVLAGFGAPAPVVAVPGLVALAAIVVDTRRDQRAGAAPASALGGAGLARVSLAGAAVAAAAPASGVGPACAVVAAAILAATVAGEHAVSKVWTGAARHVSNLPGFTLTRSYLSAAPWVSMLSTALLVLATLADPAAAGGVVALVLAVALVVVLAWGTRSARRDRSRHATALTEALLQLDAPVMVYLSGPTGTEYQLGAWLPELERLAVKTVVVVRESRLAVRVSRMTTLPVVGAPSIADLDVVHTASFRVALYVNNGAKNGHNVRYRDLTHVQLLHGDSDKPASYNPVTAMFDKIFVAGQAGVDRYAAHGVMIPREKFVLVGRPQVAPIEARHSTEVRTVLYAPTWSGFNQDSNFGSLQWGPQIVRGLLARGWRVVFRPHPYSLAEPRSKASIAAIHELLAADAATTGLEHLWGEASTTRMSVVDCFNASDALVSDVSSVPADYLFSAKPFVITQVDDTPDEDFLEENPLARAAYRARLAVPGALDAALDGLVDDTLRDVRESTREYYLGDFPRATYRDVFGAAVADLVAGATSVGPQDGAARARATAAADAGDPDDA